MYLVKFHLSHTPSSVVEHYKHKAGIVLPGMSLRMPPKCSKPTGDFWTMIHIQLGTPICPNSIFTTIASLKSAGFKPHLNQVFGHVIPFWGDWLITGSQINTVPVNDLEGRIGQLERIMARGRSRNPYNDGATLMLRDGGAVIATSPRQERWLLRASKDVLDVQSLDTSEPTAATLLEMHVGYDAWN